MNRLRWSFSVLASQNRCSQYCILIGRCLSTFFWFLGLALMEFYPKVVYQFLLHNISSTHIRKVNFHLCEECWMCKLSTLKSNLQYNRHHHKRKCNHRRQANLVTFLIHSICQLMIIKVSSLYLAHLKLLVRFTHHNRDLQIGLYLL